MEDIIVPIGVCLVLFVGAPWVVLHYVTRWKTAATLTSGDEALLDDLYRLARRLEERMATVERLVAADHPEFRPAHRIGAAEDDQSMGELERMLAAKKGGIR